MTTDCVFCKIINDEIPSYKIYEDKYTYAFLDNANDCEGHTLVVPKKHFKNILDCDTTYLNKTMEAVQLISKHYIDNCGFDGINIINSNEECSGQSVFHLHFHIMPRRKNDGLEMLPRLSKKDFDIKKLFEKLVIRN